jgi:hypothetical protein
LPPQHLISAIPNTRPGSRCCPSGPAKWAISLAPFVLFGLSRVVNAVSPGVIFELLATIRREYLVTAWSAAGSILAFSVILIGLVYLLIRRAPLKD